MKTIIENGLHNGISYQTYRDLINGLVKNSSTTGHNQTEALANYTKLNLRRMKRWDKKINISEEAENRIKQFNNSVTWLIITESWCGDAAHVIPVLNKIAELNSNIDIKIVFRDENRELMSMFLTNGGEAIPKLIMIDNESGEVVNTYGPRPSEATSYVNRFKAMHGKLTPDFKEDLQHWYNKDKGQNIIDDVIELLGELKPTVYQ